MIRSHRIDPSFLLKIKPPDGQNPQGTGDQEEPCDTDQEPSQYNIFYSADSELLPPLSADSDLLPPLSADSELLPPLSADSELLPPLSEVTELFDVQPCPSVVEENHFPMLLETTNHLATTEHHSVTKAVHNKAEKTCSAGSITGNGSCMATKAHKMAAQDKPNAGKSVCNHLRVPAPATAASVSGTGDEQEASLSGFFLSGVKSNTSGQPESQLHEASSQHTPSQQAPGSNKDHASGDHSSQFRLGAVIWLPENSRFPTNGEAPEKINLAMELPPPSPVPSQCQAPVLEDGDDSSHEGDISDDVSSVQGVEENLWDDGDDLEAIESLAWELSSNADGRITQSSIQDGDEDGCDGEHLLTNVNSSTSIICADQVMEQFDLYRKSVMDQES